MTNCPWVTARVRRRQLVDRAGQWRRATDIRQFVARVAEHAATLSDAAERAALADWQARALAQADRLGPPDRGIADRHPRLRGSGGWAH